MAQAHDELYEVVSNVQRRQLLFALLEESQKTDPPEELNIPSNITKYEGLNKIERQHVHLPKLDEYGFINWLPEENCVEPGPKFHKIKITLGLLAEHHEEISEAE